MKPIDKATARLPSLTVPIRFGEGPNGRAHEVTVSLAYGPDHRLHEVVFVASGRGDGLETMFQDLSIGLSRAIQGRDPETGEPMAGLAR